MTLGVETRARGRFCRITLRLDDLSQVEDVEQLNIGLQSEPCGLELHGTTITLSDLHQSLAYLDANRLLRPSPAPLPDTTAVAHQGRHRADLQWAAGCLLAGGGSGPSCSISSRELKARPRIRYSWCWNQALRAK